jgi:CMP/dCMP kinase
MIISISGFHGSGKSTVAKKLAKKLSWPRYYMGGLRREAALKKGLTLAEYNKLGETDPSTDLEVDLFQKNLGETEDNFIIEGRTSWHFIPHSLKIYIDVSLEEGANRIFRQLQKENNRNEDKNLKTIEDVIESLKKRHKSDALRYKKYFNIDVHDKNNYDYVIDTTNLSIEEVFNNIYSFVNKQIKEDIDKN